MANHYFWKDDTLFINILLQSRASKNEIIGIHGNYLKIRIKAPPVDNKANDELIKFLAKEFGVASSGVKIIKGKSNRMKQACVVAPSALPENFVAAK